MPRNRRDSGHTHVDDLRGEVVRTIEREGIRQVRLATVDLLGISRAKIVSSQHFVGTTLDSGHSWSLPTVGADIWQNLPEGGGYGEEVGFGNGVLVPDLATFRRLPWAPATAHVFGDVLTSDGNPVPTPRHVLARVLKRAAELGYTPVFGNELEFYIFRPADPSRPSNPGFAPLMGMQVWFSDQALGQTQALLEEIQSHLLAMRIPAYEIFNEHGGGQFEVNLSPSSGIGAIDDVCLMKMAIKEICFRHGLRATFMGKPTNDAEFPVSGYHLHQSLLDASGQNVFSDPSDPLGLSEIGRSYVGGVLSHANALTGLAAATLTAYKRYVPGTWAPTRASWGLDNRTAMLRIVPGGQKINIENRLPSSDANPYILAAAMTAAGLDGIERQTDPGAPGSGNLLDAKVFPPVPTSPHEGADAFERDRVMVDALGRDFARMYLALLRHVWRRFLSHVTDWEIQEYRDVL